MTTTRADIKGIVQREMLRHHPQRGFIGAPVVCSCGDKFPGVMEHRTHVAEVVAVQIDRQMDAERFAYLQEGWFGAAEALDKPKEDYTFPGARHPAGWASAARHLREAWRQAHQQSTTPKREEAQSDG